MSIPDLHVGHNTNFTKRKSQHKQSCESENDVSLNHYISKVIRDNGNWCNWALVLIETRACDDALEARSVERDYIEQLRATLNTSIPSISKREYYLDNSDTIIEQVKLYYSDNVEMTRECNQTYHKEHNG